MTEDLPLSDDGVRCMDPVATLQDDVKGTLLSDARGARLKAGGCLPLPFLDPSTSARCAFAQDDTLRALFHYETRCFLPFLGRFVVSERNKMAVFCQLLAFGTGFAYVWA